MTNRKTVADVSFSSLVVDTHAAEWTPEDGTLLLACITGEATTVILCSLSRCNNQLANLLQKCPSKKFK